jgi:hypothetical protein
MGRPGSGGRRGGIKMISARMSAAVAAAAVALALAGQAQASWTFVTVDAPADPALFGTVVTDVNNHGQTSGYYVDLAPTGDPSNPFAQVFHAFTGSADGTVFTGIDRPGFSQNGASGINNAGDIVGVSGQTGGSGAGYLRSAGGSFSDVDPASQGLPAVYSEAIAVSDAGTVTGYFATAQLPDGSPDPTSVHGYIYQGGAFSQFDVPSSLGFATQLGKINSSGVMIGGYVDLSGNSRGFIYTPGLGISTPVIPGGAASSEIGSINDAGDYVASGLTDTFASPIGYVAQGFVFKAGGFHPIHAPGAFSTEPLGINAQGQVSGLYIDPFGIHGFIANPVPEPGAWAMMLTGFAGLGMAMRSRRRAVRSA